MKHLLLSLFAFVLFSNYANAQKPAKSLEGTKWFYHDTETGNKYTNKLLPGGKMETTHPNDQTPDNDTWWQEGEYVYMSFNDGYAVYKGKLVGKKVLKGTASNETKKTWDFEMKRKK